MKRTWLPAILTLAVCLPAQARDVVVHRKNGTTYRRSAPDGNKSNNWSTKGNYNPYTGKAGTKNPYSSGGGRTVRVLGGGTLTLPDPGTERNYGGIPGGNYRNPGGAGGTGVVPPIGGTPASPLYPGGYLFGNAEGTGSVEVLTRPKRNGPQLAGAKLVKWDLTLADLRWGNLSGADLTSANLIHAELEGADLSNANLSSAILTGAGLKDAKVSGASFGQADLSGADLRGVDLSMAQLTGANFKHALYDRETTWPDGFDPKAAGAIEKKN